LSPDAERLQYSAKAGLDPAGPLKVLHRGPLTPSCRTNDERQVAVVFLAAEIVDLQAPIDSLLPLASPVPTMTVQRIARTGDAQIGVPLSGERDQPARCACTKSTKARNGAGTWRRPG
jgi:hypothetical protein